MNNGVFRQAVIDDYARWLRSWISSGHRPTHYYDYPFNRRDWLYAERDFTTGGECGSLAVQIVVEPGVRHLGGDLGHNHLFFMEGPTTSGLEWVPVFRDPVFANLRGVSEFIRAEKAKDDALRGETESLSRVAHVAASRSDIGRFLGRGGDRDVVETPQGAAAQPLHGHEVTPADAAFMRAMGGAAFGPDASVGLPSGRIISGREMRRWLDAN